MTDYKDNYAKGREKLRVRRLAADKGRDANTQLGEIPLRRGKYGMDVEEYLEYYELRRVQLATSNKPKGN